ncbi:hypothetical protein RB595_007794 [Gaeumannomyces hyphopodioides]
MDFFRLRRRRPGSPATVPTDTIIPFHYYDDSKHTNGLCFDFTFRFDDVLDADKLRAALSRLLELGDWRKLGARIRRGTDGALEYHVPRRFDDARPGFAFSTAALDDVAVDEHPQASRLARPHDLDAAGLPVAFRVPAAQSPGFKAFIRSPGFPERLDDWLVSDSPQLGLHVIRFRDATLVTVSFLHSLTDMMGLSAIMDAWTAVLRGEEAQVQPFVGFDHDPLAALSNNSKPEPPPGKYLFADRLLTSWNWVLFAARYYLSIELLWPRREEERIVFLPAQHLRRMREEALAELQQQRGEGEAAAATFVSEGDVIFAWWTRVVLRAERPSPDRTLNMRNTCCCRPLLPELGLVPSAMSALVTNAVFGVITFLKVRDVLDRSLASTAAEVRRALVRQRRPEQLQALDAIRRRCLDGAGHPAIFGDPGMFAFMISNWEKAKLFKVDFSPAVVGKGLSIEKRKNHMGMPSCLQGSGTRHYATRNTGVVIGKDAGGNYWLSYNLRKGAWPAVEQQLVALSKEDTNRV